ncbi:Uncharacterised protein [Mycobacteroides abscessus subsp. abscessus]|nr:Uncharacterised protein [Mycobacteroides abscessus subsp. abscessus]
MVPGAVQHLVVGVQGDQRVVGADGGFGQPVDDGADGFGVQGGAEPVLGHAAQHPVVDGHHQFATAALVFEDDRRIGFDGAAASDQTPFVQNGQIPREPQQRTADDAVPATGPHEQIRGGEHAGGIGPDRRTGARRRRGDRHHDRG